MQVSPLLVPFRDAENPFSFFANLILDRSNELNQMAEAACDLDTPAGTQPTTTTQPTTPASTPITDATDAASSSSHGSSSSSSSSVDGPGTAAPLQKRYDPIARVRSRYVLVHKGGQSE